jgi:ferredoxin
MVLPGGRRRRDDSVNEGTLRVDWRACRAYGACALAAPRLVTLDDWGFPMFDLDHPVPERLIGEARRAVADCPTLAIALDPAIARRARP